MSCVATAIGCWALFGFGMAVSTAGQTAASRGPDTQADTQEVQELVARLDGDSWDDRQAAERALAAHGMAAVPLVAAEIVAGSPESATRSARVLQRIAAAAEEGDMTRVAAVFHYLSGNGYPHLADAARQLSRHWKETRMERTRQQIEACGIELTAIGSGLAGGVMVIDELELDRPEPLPQEPERPAAPLRSPDELIAGINELLEASDEELEAQMRDALTESRPAPREFPRASVSVVIDGRILNLEPGQKQYHSAIVTADSDRVAEGLTLMRLLTAVPHVEFVDQEINGEMLQALAGVPGLGAVTLSRCRYDIREMLEFVREHPAIQVTSSGHDAFLGVSLEPLPGVGGFGSDQGDGSETDGCVISTVVEGSAADSAGLRVGDAILEIDRYPITEFDELVLLIASKAPGDRLQIRIRQGGEVRDLEIELRTRPPGE